MTCEACKTTTRYNFNNRCCLVRWLNATFKPHAVAWLDQYQIRHGKTAMLELINEAKAAKEGNT